MQTNSVFTKAWLKITYKQKAYLPVVILQRANSLRTLVVDQGHPLDRKLGYYVQDCYLFPRDDTNQTKNLLESQFFNYPEFKRKLSVNSQKIDQKNLKYLPVGQNLMIDLQLTVQNDKTNINDQQLQKYYNTHLQTLLSNKKQNQRIVVILTKQNKNPHYYINPLLQLLGKSQQLWPHRLKIEKLNVILKKLLFNISIQLKLGFVQHRSNLKQSRKAMYVHLKPYMSILPSQALSIPSEILGIGNTQKFCKMYKGPQVNYPQTSPSQIQAIVDAFLSLGVEVKQIHPIMKLLSIIINLTKLQIQQQTDGGSDSKYISYHLKSIQQSLNDPITNIAQLTQIDYQRIQNMLIYGEIDGGGGKSLKQKQNSSFLENLGTKQQLATYRLHMFKFILYEIFITEVCNIINSQLMTQDFVNESIVQNTQFHNKCFIVYSYGVLDKDKKLMNIDQHMKNTLFWTNGRDKLQKKIVQITKATILSSLLGTIPLKDSQKQKPKTEQTQKKQSAEPGYISKRKKAGIQQRKNLQLKNIKSAINYQQQINQIKQMIESPQKNNLQYNEIILLEKQKALLKLYYQMSQYRIFSEISMHLFNKVIKKSVVQQIPYTFYQYIWPNFQELEKGQGHTPLSFTKEQVFITNNKLILQDQKFIEKMIDALHKKKVKINEGEQNKQNIQIRLAQFANRYLYNKLCVENIHRVYPKKIQKFSKKATKQDKIKKASPYSDHLISAQQLQKKIETYIAKQTPQNLQITKMNGVYTKNEDKVVRINNKKYFQQLQKQVQIQSQKAKKIQRQFITYKNRIKTNQILFKIMRQRKLQKILQRLKIRLFKRQTMNILKMNSDESYRQQQLRKKRLKNLKQQDLFRERQRMRKQRESKRVAALAKEQQRRKAQQQRLRNYQDGKQQQQQQQNNIPNDPYQYEQQPNQNTTTAKKTRKPYENYQQNRNKNNYNEDYNQEPNQKQNQNNQNNNYYQQPNEQQEIQEDPYPYTNKNTKSNTNTTPNKNPSPSPTQNKNTSPSPSPTQNKNTSPNPTQNKNTSPSPTQNKNPNTSPSPTPKQQQKQPKKRPIQPIQQQNIQQDDAPFILQQQPKVTPKNKSQKYYSYQQEQQQQRNLFALQNPDKKYDSQNRNRMTPTNKQQYTSQKTGQAGKQPGLTTPKSNTNQQPTSSSNQPKQPTHASKPNQQPTTSTHEPTSDPNKQPVQNNNNQQPTSTTPQQPKKSNTQPSSNTGQPTSSTTNTQPIQKSNQPTTATYTSPNQTKLATQQPNSNMDPNQPSNATQQQTNQPLSSNSKPVSNSNQNQQPTTSTNPNQPTSGGQQPTSTSGPTQQPSSATQKPNSTQNPSQQPTSTTQQPTSNPNQQPTSTSNPNQNTQKNPPTQEPTSTNKQPTSTAQPTNNQPTSSTNTNQQPQTTTQKPPNQQKNNNDYKVVVQPTKPKQDQKNPQTTPKKQQKKNQTQYITKSPNLQQLTPEQLQSIKDTPTSTLQQWQKNSKIKIGLSKNPKKQIYTKYANMTQRIDKKVFEYPKLIPNEQMIKLLNGNDFFATAKSIVNCNNEQQNLKKLLMNQTSQMSAPLLKQYPIEKYPNFFKDTFNAILKIGLQKNSTKKTFELLNVFTIPLSRSYYEELQKIKILSPQSQEFPTEYSSPHNALKDETFLYFVKQINFDNPQKYQKNYYGYLYALSILTRHYCPSPKILKSYALHFYVLYMSAIQKKTNQTQIQLLQSVFQNLLFFVQASQRLKGNKIKAFIKQENKLIPQKNQKQARGYLQLKKGPIRQNQVPQFQQGKKPEPPVVTIWLINNQSYIYPVRNENALSLKRLLLEQIGYLDRQNCFQLYFFEPDYSYTLVNQKQKCTNLLILMQIYKEQKRRRPIYLRISNYFPFILKDLNTTRMMYMNMVSDQLTFPWTAEQYEFVVAQSMVYEDYEDVRIGNYLQFSGQAASKQPNMRPVTQKYKIISVDATKKCCQLQYLKYIKTLGFFLSKCYGVEDDPNYVIMVKPYQFAIYKHTKLFSSISFKRIKNVYVEGGKIILEVYYKNTLEKGKEQKTQRLRKHTIQQAKKGSQLFHSILFHLQNRISA